MTSFAGIVRWDGGSACLDRRDALAAALSMPGARPARHIREDGVLFVHRQTETAPEDRRARQPLIGKDGRLILLFDGYLTNRETLAAALPVDAGAADADYALAAFERWGADAAGHLEGDFAFAAWDEQDRRLILACDILGPRPIYYHQGQGWLAFATNIRALLALPDIPHGVDEVCLVDHMLDLSGDPHRTFHAAIRCLPAACIAIADGHGCETRRYWRPENVRPIRYRRDEDYVEAARELLDRSVAACLRLVGPPVTTITGGLDSSAVAVTAARLLNPNPLITVTAVTAEGVPLPNLKSDYVDERPLVEAIARLYPNMRPIFISGSAPHRWDEKWRDLFLLIGMPLRNIMNVAWFGPLRDQVRDLGATVLLVGVLGNLTLSWGGLDALRSSVRRGRWLHVLRECRLIARHTATPLSHQLWRRAIGPALPEAVREGVYRLLKPSATASWMAQSALRSDIAESSGAVERLRDHQRRLRQPDPRSWVLSRIQSRSQIYGLTRYMYGLEMRDPFSNRQLLEFCFAIPGEQYQRQGVGRFLARRVLADRLPPEVTGNMRRGFQSADYFHRMTQMREFIAGGVEELEGSSLANRFLDLPRMKRLMTAWPDDAGEAGIEYLSVLHRGLQYGQFLRWIESGNG